MRIDTKNKLHAKYQGECVAFARVFEAKSPFTATVLENLARFCRADATTFHLDARAHALLEGRREVWLRIQEYLTSTADQLLNKYSKEVANTEFQQDNGDI